MLSMTCCRQTFSLHAQEPTNIDFTQDSTMNMGNTRRSFIFCRHAEGQVEKRSSALCFSTGNSLQILLKLDSSVWRRPLLIFLATIKLVLTSRLSSTHTLPSILFKIYICHNLKEEVDAFETLDIFFKQR